MLLYSLAYYFNERQNHYGDLFDAGFRMSAGGRKLLSCQDIGIIQCVCHNSVNSLELLRNCSDVLLDVSTHEKHVELNSLTFVATKQNNTKKIHTKNVKGKKWSVKEDIGVWNEILVAYE